MPIRFAAYHGARDRRGLFTLESLSGVVLQTSPFGLSNSAHNKGFRIDDGCHSRRHSGRLLRLLLCLYVRLRQALREAAMLFDYVFSGAITVFLTIYLTYALIRPERF
jgi:K+-transporting ATPase KdpF subunit